MATAERSFLSGEKDARRSRGDHHHCVHTRRGTSTPGTGSIFPENHASGTLGVTSTSGLAPVARSAQLSEAEQQLLSFIRQEQTVDLAYILAQQFVHLMREHRVEELDTWLSTCASARFLIWKPLQQDCKRRFLLSVQP